MPGQIFISYSTEDRSIAEAACGKLESAGVRCWMAPRDIVPGVQWGEAIIDAINASDLLVLVFSAHANASRQVIREVERAVNRGIEVIPLRIEEVTPSKSLEFFISSAHWLDAFSSPLDPHLDRLVAAVGRLLAEPEPRETETILTSRATMPRVAAPKERAASGRSSAAHPRFGSRLRWTAALLVGGGAIGVFILSVLNNGTPGAMALTISSPPAELFVGDTFPLQANVTGAGEGDVAVQWSSSDRTIVRREGGDTLFVAAGPGSVWLRAQADSVRDSVRVTVEQPVIASIGIAPPGPLRVGDTLALQAVATDRRGRNIAAVTPTWVSSAPRIASVDSARGIVRGRAAGRTLITANAGTTSSSVEVIVERVASPGNVGSQTNLGVATDPGPSAPPLTEAALRALADSCIRALRSGDSAWVATHYQPATGADLSNLTALSRLFRYSAYQLADSQVLTPQIAAATVSFRARFTYRSNFGQGRTLSADFEVTAVPGTGGGARLRSCRVSGNLEL
jgi:hypothetical protein